MHTVSISPALRCLLLAHQTWCTADCCRERAFEISEDTILRWLEFERVDRTREIAEEIERISTDIEHRAERIVLAARGLESKWDAKSFSAFWKQVQKNFERAVESRAKNRN